MPAILTLLLSFLGGAGARALGGRAVASGVGQKLIGKLPAMLTSAKAGKVASFGTDIAGFAGGGMLGEHLFAEQTPTDSLMPQMTTLMQNRQAVQQVGTEQELMQALRTMGVDPDELFTAMGGQGRLV